MRVLDTIAKKRDGHCLSDQEIRCLIRAYQQEEIPDYQMSAWLMAVFLRGMNSEETASLTLAMAESGNMVDLSGVGGIKVDKHSTGGVADTTTLILAPLVAAAGVPVAKMSGRGLGFTGGTIDKLEAIPGFCATLTERQFIDNLQRHNIAITGQSKDIAPADGKLYALRDVTATIESIPLIASSIMSKKIAAGADKIVLDVKVGQGAFMKDLNQAILLAEAMVRIGALVGRETMAVLTGMEQPLGQAVGNSLEVREAIDVLIGKGPAALRDICLFLGAHMLVLGGKAADVSAGKAKLIELLHNGQALRKFTDFISAQGGDAQIVHQPSRLPQAEFSQRIFSSRSGYIQHIYADQVGYSAMLLGAGREKKGDAIDLSAGILLHCRVGDHVDKSQLIATLYSSRKEKLTRIAQDFETAITVAAEPVQAPALVLGIVDRNGYQPNKVI